MPAGTVKITDNFGEVVCGRYFRCEADRIKIKEIWKKVYGLRYNERNIIVIYEPVAEKYIKPKPAGIRATASRSGKKTPRRVSPLHQKRKFVNSKHPC